MDGVLIDSVQAGLRMRRKLLAKYGVDLDTVPDPQGEGHRASSMKSLLASVKSHQGVHIDHDEFASLAIEHMPKILQEHGVSADPGLIKFLKELKQHNIVCAIASSGLRAGVETKLEILGIKQYFSVIVTGSDVKVHKPHPESYLYAMEKLGMAAEDCVIIEDSLTGVQAAHAAGCRVIGFAQYNPSKEPLAGVVTTVIHWNEMSYHQLQHLS